MTTMNTGLRGVWPALLTPLDENLNIDHVLLLKHCQRLLALGCAGLTLFGTTGEGPSFSLTERQTTLQALIDGGIPAAKILVSTSCAALPETVELSRHAVSLGCAGCLILPPFFLKGVPDQGVIDAYEWIIEKVNDPQLKIMLYHIPQVAGVGLSVAVVAELLKRHPNVILGLKDSSCQLDQSLAFARAVMPPMQVWVGNELDVQTMAGMGTLGCVSGVANVLPRLVGRLVTQPTAIQAPADLARVKTFLGILGGYGLTAAFKGVMADIDAHPGWLRVRPPLLALSNAEINSLRAQMQAFALDPNND